jgi:hypothetical protein
MRQAPPESDTHAPQEPDKQGKPGLLSQSDPPPETSTHRPPILLIVIVVLLVTGFVLLHLTGVVGPGSH